MSREFWEARLRQFGHTGWSDAPTYAFDQCLRLAAVTRLIAGHASGSDLAIDFGCGTGDFTKVLARQFRNVIATDISVDILAAARRRVPANVQLVMSDELRARVQPGSVDLVLSVTVLQHIVEDRALDETMKLFHDSLRAGGTVIVLESFVGRVAQHYMRSWTQEELLARFDAAGMRLVEHRHFPNPSSSPPPSFEKFMNSVATRVLTRLGSSAAVQRLLRMNAERWITSAEAFAPHPTGSGMFVFTKA